MRPLVVAIDGPAGAGKSTVSRRLAQRLGFQYVDTGSMYRVIGVLAAERGIAPDDAAALDQLCRETRISFRDDEQGRTRVFADGRDLTEAIRTPEAAQWASKVSAVPEVRAHLVAQQRALGARGGVVMEGRDIGTVVFPDAMAKFFLDASPLERARRRAAEWHREVSEAEIEAVAKEIAERDARDRQRAHAPLKPAPDAVYVDTTEKSIDEVVQMLYEIVAARRAELARL
ncbi:MAG: (d)CMP kinase [Candidatus Binatia bacterium]|nr:(d)CMP kinase [Candidatus Binatia bacterium]